jgi:hypothetical protein
LLLEELDNVGETALEKRRQRRRETDGQQDMSAQEETVNTDEASGQQQ